MAIISNLLFALVVALMSIMGYQYVEEGYGLHPALGIAIGTVALILNLCGSGLIFTQSGK